MTFSKLPLFAFCLALPALSAIADEKKPPKARDAKPAQDAPAPKEPDPQAGDIHVIVEYIEVEHEAFSDWLLENSLKADATALRKEVQRWVKDDSAEIFETTVVHARSGQRAKVESIEEMIYPTEYDPPEVPEHSNVQDGAEIPITPPTATAFETRNVGITLEVDPVLSADNRHVDLNLAPEIVQLLDIQEWETHAAGADGIYATPLFHAAKATTQLTTKVGSYSLMGTLRLPEPINEDREDPLVLLFVRADAG